MAKASNKNFIKKRDNWVSSFTLIGEAKVNDYTFKLDEQSEKSNWIYNSMNIGIDCGEKYGVVYSEMMGGYGSGGENVIMVHGKKEDGSDDFEQKIQIDWDDRFNDDIIDTVGDLSFITVGLEKTDKNNTFYKKFLSQYDAIAYIKEHIEDGMVVNVKGNLKYSSYQDKTQVRKNIQSIVLSKVDDASKYDAKFTQTVLIDSHSASLKNVDKDKGVMYVDTKVLDYVKTLNGVDFKSQYPFYKEFEFKLDLTDKNKCQKVVEKLFKVKKDTISQITFEGKFIEGGATVTATLDDIPDDIKDLIECGVYTEEEALKRCSSNGSREQRMVFIKPYIKLTGDDKIPVLQKFDSKYTEDELDFSWVDADKEEVPFKEDSNSSNDSDSEDDSVEKEDNMDWLNNL